MKTEARHTLIKGWDQQKISRATVLIGGCGAIGSQAAVTLARIGIGRIIVVDNDMLEEHNIHNQVFRKDQIGKNKVDALKEIVGEIGDTEFVGINSNVQEVQFDRFKPDAFLGCFDNVGARFFLNYIAITSRTPYIDAGIEGYTGGVRLIQPDSGPCLQCWPSMMKENKVKAGCSSDPIPSTYFTASYASNLQVMELLNYLFGRQTHPMIYFDLERGVTSPIKLERNEECELCSSRT